MITRVVSLTEKLSFVLNHESNNKWLGAFIVFFAGAILPLAHSPVDFYPVAFISPVIFFLALLNTTPARAAWLGWWFGMGLFGIGVSWLFVAVYVFGQTPLIFSGILTFLFINVFTLFFVAQAWSGAWFIRKFSINNETLQLALVFPLFWVLFEWIRGWFLTGFPWLSIGYSQTDTVLAGFAPVLGVFGVSLIVVLLSSAFFLLSRNLTSAFKTQLPFIFVIVASFTGGYLLSTIEWTNKKDNALKVSLVQGNVEQMGKWEPEHFEERRETYFSLTEKHWDSDLVVWPENSLTLFYHQMKKSVLKPLADEAKRTKTDMILGLPYLDRENDLYYSSLMSIKSMSPGKDTPYQFYHKSHLVPFGEYVPLEKWLRGLIGFFDLPMSGFTPGSFEQPLFEVAGEKVAPTICYEDVFGEELIRFLPEATLILNASNNAWYGDSFAPHQHLQISRMRAIETERDVMRVTTNGVSAIIDYRGKIITRSPQFEAAVVSGTVIPRTGATPYVNWGNLPILLIILIGLIVSVRLGRR